MRLIGKRFSFLARVSALALASASSAALAQAVQEGEPTDAPAADAPAADAPAADVSTADQAEDASAGDIVVTAQKREERLNDVPMSISVASGDKLEELGITDPGELQKIVPGFSATRSRYGTPVYTIRGVGFQNSSLGANPTVSAYLDEVPLPFSALAQGLPLDLERVEVLKGPQGTLFGNNSTGGALNFVAAKPTANPEAGVNFSFGRFSTIDVDGFVSGPLTDTLSYRLAANWIHSGPWQKSYTRDAELGRQDFLNFRGILQWEPTPDFTARLTLSAFRDRSETQASQFHFFRRRGSGVIPPGYIAYPIAPENNRAADWSVCVPRYGSDNLVGEDLIRGCGDYRRSNRFRSASLRLEYSLADNLDLTSVSAYHHYERFQPEDQDGTTFFNYSDVAYGHIEVASQELRLSGRFGSQGNWVVGGNYEWDDVNDLFLQTFPDSSSNPIFGFVTLRDLVPRGRQKVSTKAIFVNADYPILATVTIEAGARYTDQDRDFRGCGQDSGNGDWANVAAAVRNFIAFGNPRAGIIQSLGPGTCASLGPPPQNLPEEFVSSLNEDNFAWRVGVKFQPTDATLLYANVSKGFKSGSFPTLGASVNSQLAPVVQEELLAYEAGFKQSLLSRTLQLNGAVYYYDYKNKQIDGFILSPVFGALSAIVNIPESHVTGFELSAEWRPVRGLAINSSVSLADSEIDEFLNRNAFGQIQDFAGSPFPLAPKWQAAVDASYEWSIGAETTAFVGGNLSYQDETPGTLGDLEPFHIDAYTLVDVRAGIERGPVRLQLWARNLSDKYYWTSAYYATDAIVRFAGRPRTFGFTLSWRYEQ